MQLLVVICLCLALHVADSSGCPENGIEYVGTGTVYVFPPETWPWPYYGGQTVENPLDLHWLYSISPPYGMDRIRNPRPKVSWQDCAQRCQKSMTHYGGHSSDGWPSFDDGPCQFWTHYQDDTYKEVGKCVFYTGTEAPTTNELSTATSGARFCPGQNACPLDAGYYGAPTAAVPHETDCDKYYCCSGSGCAQPWRRGDKYEAPALVECRAGEVFIAKDGICALNPPPRDVLGPCANL